MKSDTKKVPPVRETPYLTEIYLFLMSIHDMRFLFICHYFVYNYSGSVVMNKNIVNKLPYSIISIRPIFFIFLVT